METNNNNNNQTKTEPYSDEVFKKLFDSNSALYTAYYQHLPNEWPEKRIILEKITETGLWLRLAHAVNPIGLGVKITPKSAVEAPNAGTKN